MDLDGLNMDDTDYFWSLRLAMILYEKYELASITHQL